MFEDQDDVGLWIYEMCGWAWEQAKKMKEDLQKQLAEADKVPHPKP